MLKTIKLGNILRILSIFRVQKAIIYDAGASEAERILLQDLVEYGLCAPYLRRFQFRLESNLKFASAMPAILSPNHVGLEIPSEAEENLRCWREGLVQTHSSKKKYVEVGLKTPLRVGPLDLENGVRVALELSGTLNKGQGSQSTIDWQISRLAPVETIYWTTSFEWARTALREVIEVQRRLGHFIIGTSRFGDDVRHHIDQIASATSENQAVTLVFGTVKRGIQELISPQQPRDLLDIWINFFPHQGSEIIKVEEAILGVLSLLQITFPV
jgi:predicted SPOUT superfamily RNA methylase MTH1